MKKFLLAVIILLIVTTGFAAFRYLGNNDSKSVTLSPTKAHLYKDPNIDIAKIGIKMFYAVPQNRLSDLNPVWQKTLTEALDKTQKFHHLQFRGLSEIRYDIFPKPIILSNKDSFYDTTSTSAGNPRGLIDVAREIDRRVFHDGGDLYDKNFIRFEDGEYPVMGLLYEGVGASGGVIYESELETAKEIAEKLGVPESIVYIVDISSVKGFFLLNEHFLSDTRYINFGPTIFYHEFAHTIGLPDRFDQNDKPSSDDIMGGGRWEPIGANYIENDTLGDLGVIPGK